MRDQHLRRNPPCDVQRALRFLYRPSARGRVGAGDRQRSQQASAVIAPTDRCVDPVELETRFREPLLEIGDRGRTVVVEMRLGREHLDRLKTVRRDLNEMIPAQAPVVVQVPL